MNKFVVVAVAAGLAFVSIPSYAINAHYRDQLVRSGCTQVTDGNSTCDIHKTKAQNEKAQRDGYRYNQTRQKPLSPSYKALTTQAESIIGVDIGEAADFLLAQGWKANNGEWHKAGHTLRLVVEDAVVRNAQLIN